MNIISNKEDNGKLFDMLYNEYINEKNDVNNTKKFTKI